MDSFHTQSYYIHLVADNLSSVMAEDLFYSHHSQAVQIVEQERLAPIHKKEVARDDEDDRKEDGDHRYTDNPVAAAAVGNLHNQSQIEDLYLVDRDHHILAMKDIHEVMDDHLDDADDTAVFGY